jgi:hypothetical protein
MKGALTAASAVDTTVWALKTHFAFAGSLGDRRAHRLTSDYGEAVARYARLVDDFVDAANRVARSTT